MVWNVMDFLFFNFWLVLIIYNVVYINGKQLFYSNVLTLYRDNLLDIRELECCELKVNIINIE